MPVPRRVPQPPDEGINSSISAAFATPHADLENRWSRKRLEGSNPSPSARQNHRLYALHRGAVPQRPADDLPAGDGFRRPLGSLPPNDYVQEAEMNTKT